MVFDVLQSIGATRIFFIRVKAVAVTRFFFGAKIRQAATPSKILTSSNPCRRFAFNGWGGFAIAIFSDSGVAAFRCIGSAA